LNDLIGVAGYLGLMGVYFYGWKEDIVVSEPWGWIFLAGLAALQLAAGFVIRSWRALGLPFAAILVAFPFGYGEGVGQEAPIWLYYGSALSIPAAALVAAGVGGRKIRARRR
jgi:hypothetical protein